jgi:hypothetical protein
VRRAVIPSLFVAVLAGTSLSACGVCNHEFRPVHDSLAERAPRDDAPYVWVLGAVGQPGRYRIIGAATLSLVLRDAGGVNPSAYRKIIVSRRGQAGWVRRVYDIDDIEAGDVDDVQIVAGDVIDVVERQD